MKEWFGDLNRKQRIRLSYEFLIRFFKKLELEWSSFPLGVSLLCGWNPCTWPNLHHLQNNWIVYEASQYCKFLHEKCRRVPCASILSFCPALFRTYRCITVSTVSFSTKVTTKIITNLQIHWIHWETEH